MLETAALAAIASPRRREILRLIWTGERAAGDIHAAMPDVTFGAVSLQLARLKRAGLVTVRRQHKQRFYAARRTALGPVAATLESMWDDALWTLKLQAELEELRTARQRLEERVEIAGRRPLRSEPRLADHL